MNLKNRAGFREQRASAAKLYVVSNARTRRLGIAGRRAWITDTGQGTYQITVDGLPGRVFALNRSELEISYD